MVLIDPPLWRLNDAFIFLPLLLIACGEADTNKDDTVATPTDSHVDTST